jgi:nitrite reductase/ring-hydroxylating ferredoxin subunit
MSGAALTRPRKPDGFSVWGGGEPDAWAELLHPSEGAPAARAGGAGRVATLLKFLFRRACAYGVLAFERFEVAVFKLDGQFFAYLNPCPHMGGPACQGKMMAKVEEIIADDRTSKGMSFSKTKMHVVCPWHGYEFDIRTGVHPENPQARLRKMAMAVSGDDVIIGLPDVGQHAKQAAQPT